MWDVVAPIRSLDVGRGCSNQKPGCGTWLLQSEAWTLDVVAPIRNVDVGRGCSNQKDVGRGCSNQKPGRWTWLLQSEAWTFDVADQSEAAKKIVQLRQKNKKNIQLYTPKKV
jgi:hypothetical protein